MPFWLDPISLRTLLKFIRVNLFRKIKIMANLNPRLTINIHVIDIATDKEEGDKQYQISKVHVDLSKHRNYSAAKDDYDKQQSALNAKYEKIMNLIIWAMNNKKELHFINREDDE